MWMSTTKVARLEAVTSQTIRRWIQKGKYETRTTDGGHLRIKYDMPRHTICYARVSSSKQVSSITTQQELLRASYPEAEFASDIGSGFNFKRRSFVRVLERVLQGEAIRLVATTPDRISRSGLTFITRVIELYGGETVFLENKDTTESLDVTTLISFLTSFCNSQSGKRNASRHKESKNIP